LEAERGNPSAWPRRSCRSSVPGADGEVDDDAGTRQRRWQVEQLHDRRLIRAGERREDAAEVFGAAGEERVLHGGVERAADPLTVCTNTAGSRA
jgi:hypothetical protein